MSLLEQKIIRKGRGDKSTTKLEFDISNKKEYKVEEIRDNALSDKESKYHPPRYYYLILRKNYSKEKNT